MSTRIELSGGFRILRNGDTVAVAYQRARALLAFLALEPGRHSRERLIELLWPASEPQAGRDSLRRMLSVLRAALGPEQGALAADRCGVALNLGAGLSCDITDFLAPKTHCKHRCDPAHRSLCIANSERTLTLYSAPLLADMSFADAPDFERWVDIRRSDCQHRVEALLERLCNCLEQAGDRAGALRHTRRRLELAPTNEAVLRRAMALLAESGQTTEALAHHEVCKRRLADELDATPEAATTALAAAIRAGKLQTTTTMPAPAPQRRPLVVLCLRIAAEAADDPDAHAERVGTEQVRLTRLVEQAGGHAGATLAGMLIAWFGYPQAREDATRLAVTCALEAVEPGIAAGIETGLTICDPGSGQADVAGGLTRAAMALAERAEAGQVLIGAAADQATAGWFRRTALAPGIYRIQGGSGAASRLEARPSPAPLLGRAREYAQLYSAWLATRSGRGQVWLVRGEAGIGKSRLVAELAKSIDRHWLVRCRPEWAHTPFKPIVNLLADVLGPAADADLGTRQRRIATQWPGLATSVCNHLAEFIGVGHAASPPTHPAARQGLIEALATALSALPQGEPTLLWLEDVHWADPSTLEVLFRLAIARPAALCLVCTARPAFQPDWPVQALDLAGLASADSADLAQRLGGGRLEEKSLRALLDRAAGIPLFIEELTRAAVADGPAGLPHTLAELLAARLDHFPDARQAVQLAATAGQRFEWSWLEHAAHVDECLDRQIERLIRADLIRREPESGLLAFNHALFQEAAYGSMPAATRRANHGRIAAALLAVDPGLAERDPALLAWHFSNAESGQEAIRFSVAAARLAASRHAPGEALHHLDGALRHCLRLPEGPGREAQELEIHLHRGPALAALHGYGSPAARSAYEQALRLAGPTTDNPAMLPLIWGLWLGSSSWSNYHVSLDLAHRLMALAERRADDPHAICHAHYALGNSLFCRGEFAAAAMTLEAGLTLFPEDAPPSPYGEDPAVTSLAFLSWTYWYLGRDQAALATSARSLERAHALGQPHTICYATIFAAKLHRLRGDIDATARLGQSAHDLAHEHGLALWIAAGQLMLGWAHAAAGDSAGLAVIGDSANQIKDIMGGVETIFLAQLLDACERLGAWRQALEAAEMGLHIGGEKRDRHHEAGFLRGKALALAALGLEGSEALWAQAQALAREQGAVALLVRIDHTPVCA